MADAGESQASENQASVNLVELFHAGENGIERRRTENLFKQLDERQLTEDEHAIIQQRVELQRKMFQEYERREKQRKLRELQEVCPDLDEDAARRALELCNWKEELAAEKVSSDPAFVRRVCSGAAAQAEHAPAAPRPERRGGSSKAVVGPRPRLVDPSQVGAVFVGRFKGRLGPHQISAMGRQQQTAAAAAAAAPRAAADTPTHAQQQQQEEEQAAGVNNSGGGGPVDVEMADADVGPTAGGVVEPDSADLGGDGDVGTEDREEEEEEQEEDDGGGEDGDGEVEDPNSADLSDNELQYEDDVQLPVLSPLAERKRQRSEQDQGQEQGQQGEQQQQQQGQEPAEAGQQDVAAARAAAGGGGGLPLNDPQGTVRNLTAALAGEEEVSSPARAGQRPQKAAAAAADTVAAVTTAAAPPGAATVTAGTAVAAARPRRATAELAAALRHVDDSDEVRSDAETASDGGDSDFELGSGGKGGGGRGGGAAAHGGGDDDDMTSSGSDVDLEEEEEDSDGFVAAGSRKRRAGGAAGGKRQQQARKRAASGGSGGGGVGRASRSRAAAQRQSAAPPPPPGAAAIAVATCAAAAAADVEAPEAAGPSGRAGIEAAAAVGGSGRAEEDSEATVTEDESPGGRTKRQPKGGKKGRGASGGGGKGAKGGGGSAGGGGGGGAGGGAAAISASGHTCRGRVKQKGVKRADLLAVGSLIARAGWFNAGYIFPAGFRAQTLFRSSVDLDSLTLHTCAILGQEGQYWPAPTFVVTAADRPDEPLVAKSCTGCWTAVLRRINGEIEGRRAAGEDLPPPPKTAIAGPEYFGLNQPEICAAIEALDSERKCATYWDGKHDREAARGGQPVPARGGRGASGGSAGGAATAAAAAAAAPASGAAAVRPPRGAGRSTSNGGGGGKGRRGGRRGSGAADDDEEGPGAGGNEGEEDPEETYAGNRWSAVTRAERYRKRCEDAGEDGAALLEASKRDNPLPGFLDPITLEPVFNPAISPYGHVMGLATWKAVLAEHGRCPFTKQPLKAEALTVLTKNNIERFRSRIIQQ
ncbi:hypothetical protein PLESTB_001384900 [Pleodorina starrii]|uniref:U-box domain-containing protein n=1 Tax=Pleodorina starrii TaxID=330485 RepID=A0A9W6BW67_9CHLO|nr:hypothetical protein PLESTB_001384900 [Pleodorina starrii]